MAETPYASRQEFIADYKRQVPQDYFVPDDELYNRVIEQHPEYRKLIAEDAAIPIVTPDGWLGPAPSKPLSEIPGGTEYEKLATRDSRRGFIEASMDLGLDDVPFVADLYDVGKLVMNNRRLSALNRGEKLSDVDLVKLNHTLAYQKRLSDATVLGKVSDIVQGSARFAAEIAITLGTLGAAGGMKATTSGAVKLAEAAATKAGATAAAKKAALDLAALTAKKEGTKKLGMLSTKMLNAQIVRAQTALVIEDWTAKTAAKWMGTSLGKQAGAKAVNRAAKIAAVGAYGGATGLGMSLSPLMAPKIMASGQQARMAALLQGKDMNLAQAVFMGWLDTAISLTSENVGEALWLGTQGAGQGFMRASKTYLPGTVLATEAFGSSVREFVMKNSPKKARDLTLLTAGYLNRLVMRKFPDATSPGAVLSEALKVAGVNNTVEEILEERFEGFLKGLLGLQGDSWGVKNAIKQMVPSFKDFTAEVLAFSLPGALTKGTDYAVSRLIPTPKSQEAPAPDHMDIEDRETRAEARARDAIIKETPPTKGSESQFQQAMLSLPSTLDTEARGRIAQEIVYADHGTKQAQEIATILEGTLRDNDNPGTRETIADLRSNADKYNQLSRQDLLEQVLGLEVYQIPAEELTEERLGEMLGMEEGVTLAEVVAKAESETYHEEESADPENRMTEQAIIETARNRVFGDQATQETRDFVPITPVAPAPVEEVLGNPPEIASLPQTELSQGAATTLGDSEIPLDTEVIAPPIELGQTPDVEETPEAPTTEAPPVPAVETPVPEPVTLETMPYVDLKQLAREQDIPIKGGRRGIIAALNLKEAERVRTQGGTALAVETDEEGNTRIVDPLTSPNNIFNALVGIELNEKKLRESSKLAFAMLETVERPDGVDLPGRRIVLGNTAIPLDIVHEMFHLMFQFLPIHHKATLARWLRVHHGFPFSANPTAKELNDEKLWTKARAKAQGDKPGTNLGAEEITVRAFLEFLKQVSAKENTSAKTRFFPSDRDTKRKPRKPVDSLFSILGFSLESAEADLQAKKWTPGARLIHMFRTIQDVMTRLGKQLAQRYMPITSVKVHALLKKKGSISDTKILSVFESLVSPVPWSEDNTAVMGPRGLWTTEEMQRTLESRDKVSGALEEALVSLSEVNKNSGITSKYRAAKVAEGLSNLWFTAAVNLANMQLAEHSETTELGNALADFGATREMLWFDDPSVAIQAKNLARKIVAEEALKAEEAGTPMSDTDRRVRVNQVLSEAYKSHVVDEGPAYPVSLPLYVGRTSFFSLIKTGHLTSIPESTMGDDARVAPFEQAAIDLLTDEKLRNLANLFLLKPHNWGVSTEAQQEDFTKYVVDSVSEEVKQAYFASQEQAPIAAELEQEAVVESDELAKEIRGLASDMFALDNRAEYPQEYTEAVAELFEISSEEAEARLDNAATKTTIDDIEAELRRAPEVAPPSEDVIVTLTDIAERLRALAQMRAPGEAETQKAEDLREEISFALNVGEAQARGFMASMLVNLSDPNIVPADLVRTYVREATDPITGEVRFSEPTMQEANTQTSVRAQAMREGNIGELKLTPMRYAADVLRHQTELLILKSPTTDSEMGEQVDAFFKQFIEGESIDLLAAYQAIRDGKLDFRLTGMALDLLLTESQAAASKARKIGDYKAQEFFQAINTAAWRDLNTFATEAGTGLQSMKTVLNFRSPGSQFVHVINESIENAKKDLFSRDTTLQALWNFSEQERKRDPGKDLEDVLGSGDDWEDWDALPAPEDGGYNGALRKTVFQVAGEAINARMQAVIASKVPGFVTRLNEAMYRDDTPAPIMSAPDHPRTPPEVLEEQTRALLYSMYEEIVAPGNEDSVAEIQERTVRGLIEIFTGGLDLPPSAVAAAQSEAESQVQEIYLAAKNETIAVLQSYLDIFDITVTDLWTPEELKKLSLGNVIRRTQKRMDEMTDEDREKARQDILNEDEGEESDTPSSRLARRMLYVPKARERDRYKNELVDMLNAAIAPFLKKDSPKIARYSLFDKIALAFENQDTAYNVLSAAINKATGQVGLTTEEINDPSLIKGTQKRATYEMLSDLLNAQGIKLVDLVTRGAELSEDGHRVIMVSKDMLNRALSMVEREITHPDPTLFPAGVPRALFLPLRDIVRDTYSRQEATMEILVEEVVRRTGMSVSQAAPLIEKLYPVVQERLKQAKVTRLNISLTPFKDNTRLRERDAWVDRMLSLIYAGALDQDIGSVDQRALWEEEFARKFNIPVLTNEVRQALLVYADVVDRESEEENQDFQFREADMPGIRRQMYLNSAKHRARLAALQEKLKKLSGYTTMDYLGALFFSYTLSGLSTTELNFIGTFPNAVITHFANTVVELKGMPNRTNKEKMDIFVKSWSLLWRGFSDGFRGWGEMLKTNEISGAPFVSAQRLASAAPQVVETGLFVDLGKRLNLPMLRYMDNMKYVTRMLRGNDYAFSRAVDVPGLYMKLQREAAERGLQGKAVDFWTSLMMWGADGTNMTEPGAEAKLMRLADEYSNGDSRVRSELMARINIREAAHRKAVNSGATPGSYEYHALVEEALYNFLPESWRTDLEYLAGRGTYNIVEGDPLHEGRVGTWVMNAANRLKKDQPLATFIFPFVKIASMIANTGLDMSPIALFHLRKLKADKLAGETGGKSKLGASEHDIAFLQAQMVIGSSIMGALMSLAMAGLVLDDDDPFFDITAKGPADFGLKNQLRQTGFQEYTVKVGGTRWNYQMSPLALPLAFLGSIMDQARYNSTEDTTLPENLAVAFLRTMPAMLDQTFLGTVSDLMTILSSQNPETQKNKLTNMFTRTGSAFIVPNLVKQLSRLVDPTLRDAEGVFQEFMQEMPSPVPSLLGGRPRLNALGEPIKLGASSIILSLAEIPLGRDVNRFGRMVTFARAEPDEVWGALARDLIRVPVVTRGHMLEGVAMDDDQLYEYAQKRGAYLKAWISARLKNHEWDGKSREEKQADVSQMSRRLAPLVKAAMVTGEWSRVPGAPPAMRG